jgi:hypothetical protein
MSPPFVVTAFCHRLSSSPPFVTAFPKLAFVAERRNDDLLGPGHTLTLDGFSHRCSQCRGISKAGKIGRPGERQILMDERDRHAAFAHTAGYTFD